MLPLRRLTEQTVTSLQQLSFLLVFVHRGHVWHGHTRAKDVQMRLLTERGGAASDVGA